MARVSFTADLPASRSRNSIPKLKLGINETARIACLELPIAEYRHTLEKPKILNGKAVMETKERKDKSLYETNAMEYISSFLCLGDEGIMEEVGVDVDNCPACFASTRSDAVKPPKPRYAMNVVKYNTKPGTSEVANSFGITVIPWEFSEQTFKIIRKFALEGYNLQEKDLILGPCTNEDYQKFEIMASMTGAWLASESTKKTTTDTFEENKASLKDLQSLCGQVKESKWIQKDLDEVKDRWDEINGTKPNVVDAKLNKAETVTINDATEVELPASEDSEIVLDFENLLGSLKDD